MVVNLEITIANLHDRGQAWEEKAAELDAEHLDEWREEVAASLTASAWGGNSSALDQAITVTCLADRRATLVRTKRNVMSQKMVIRTEEVVFFLTCRFACCVCVVGLAEETTS